MKATALTLLVLVFYALHQDVWNWDRAEPLLFGFLPVGLTYHAAYTLCAAGVLALLVRFAWPAGLESGEDGISAESAGSTERKEETR